jgi:preprotein translocase subunit SecD
VLLFILALFGTGLWVLTPSGSAGLDRDSEHWGMRLGLDLAGGSHFVYEADFQEEWEDDERAFHLDEAVERIQRRIDRYGVAEPVIQKQGGDRILIQLPGITNVTEAKTLIEQTGFLGFRGVETNAGEPVTLSDYLADEARTEFFDSAVDGKRIFGRVTEEDIVSFPYFLEDDDEGLSFVDREGNSVDLDIDALSEAEKESYSWMPAVGEIGGVTTRLTGEFLTEALPFFPPPESMDREIKVLIEWDSDGATLFDQVANDLKDRGTYPAPQRALGIFLDDELISSPQVFPPGMTATSYGGEASITGNFTWEEARLLAIQLNSGALPMPLKQPALYESEVSATLGADFVNRALLAGGIGLGIVVLFMLLYYRLPGMLASLALLVYVALVLAIFKLIPVTLTLAGLAGFILSIGMAVDANVLIFERLKEELRAGRTLRAAVETGFNRAWAAIRDSNVSTFIICAILYWFGSSIVDSPPVMGFAVTLFIGVAISMFSAIVVTRTFLRFATGPRMSRRLAWFGVETRNV